MKKIFVFTIMVMSAMLLFAQSWNTTSPPRTIEYQEEEHDFMLSVCSNPKFCIFDFLCVGYSERNTKLLSENAYRKYACVRKQCLDRNGRFSEQRYHDLYRKVSASWKVFKEVQYINVKQWEVYMLKVKSNAFIPECPDPRTKHKLSIVPLMLE